ncbi:MAG: hypothetical protein CL670_01805 [Balneola sp.]|jgi:hypothetical protein|nr:hypothetical protein [Balneola sp.]MBE77870.1 hypothetical protein [Balneola sp.]HBX64646.1 hypothetical protein [Balneolaceae bacterium]|tara:strand:+ start:536 stop:961 length:426 start_codon:yes stop_codon:yes gene_type:complete
MSSKQPTPKQKALASLLFCGTGLAIILASAEIIPMDEAGLNAPRWVLGLCGFVFALTGVMIFMGDNKKWNNLFAAILIFAMASIGGWVALFGDGANFSGGVSSLSHSSNISLARIVFGSGAIICFLIGLYALKMHFREWNK